MLPVGGLLIAIFVAWRLAQDISANELNFANPIAFSVWACLMRFVVVPAVFIILFTGL
jgi:NSS family neurotransmitter:Na+ symporter